MNKQSISDMPITEIGEFTQDDCKQNYGFTIILENCEIYNYFTKSKQEAGFLKRRYDQWKRELQKKNQK